MNITAPVIEIYIDPEAMAKMRAWTRYATEEVSGLGLVEPIWGEGNIVGFEVVEVFILKQECSSATTELDPEAIAELMIQLEQEGRSDQLRVWWHSHADSGVFWSPTDRENIRRLNADDYIVSIVVNKAWDIRARVDFFSPVAVTLDELPVHILLGDQQLQDTCRSQVEKLVRSRPMMSLVMDPRGRKNGRGNHYQRLMEDPFAYWDGHQDDWPYLVED